MKLLKQFKGESNWIKTTFEKELRILKDCFIDLKLIKRALKRGEIIQTNFSLYKIDKEELSRKEFKKMCKKARVDEKSLCKTIFTESLKKS